MLLDVLKRRLWTDSTALFINLFVLKLRAYCICLTLRIFVLILKCIFKNCVGNKYYPKNKLSIEQAFRVNTARSSIGPCLNQLQEDLQQCFLQAYDQTRPEVDPGPVLDHDVPSHIIYTRPINNKNCINGLRGLRLSSIDWRKAPQHMVY